MPGGAGLDIGPPHPEGAHVVVVLLDEFLRQLANRDLQAPRPGDDLVVHVGEVHDESHLELGVFQVPANHVEGDGGPGMAEVAVVVNRYPAHVHADVARLPRFEGLLPPREGVVDLNGHAIFSSKGMRGLIRLAETRF